MIRRNSDQTLQPLPTVEELENLARSDIDQWRNLIVTGGAGLPFGSSTSFASHPLRAHFESSNADGKTHYVYRELMELFAEHLGLITPPASDAEVMTIRERVLEVVHYDLDANLSERCARTHRAEEKSRRLGWYMFQIVEHLSEALSYALSDVAYDVAAGVPLYRLAESRVGDEMVKDHEQPSAYLTGKALNHDTTRFPTQLPAWTEGLGFRRSDLEAFKLIFGGEFMEMSPDQFAARRAALRKHIGVPVGNEEDRKARRASGTTARSTLADALEAVLDRYYGASFSLSDPDTWPKQTAIVEWLKAERKLSDREATAVDLIARPDEMRRK